MSLSPGERAALILQLRRQTDPCYRYWKDMATPTQREVAQSNARYRLIYASNRAGKSAHAAWEVAAAARRVHPTRTTSIDGVYVIFAPFRDQIADPWYKKLRTNCELLGDCHGVPFIPDHELAMENGALAEYFTYGAGEKTIKIIKLANGNKIAFVPSAGKHVWKTIEGKGMILGIAIDEAAGNEKLLTECGVRLLDAHSHPTVKAECGGGWLLWVATETKLNNTFIDLKEKCLNQDPLYGDYRAFFLPPHENPAIDMAEREKLRTLMSAEEYKIRMEGTASAGDTMQLWPQFGAQNILKADYEPAPRDNLWFGYDPGSNYAGGIIGCIRPEEPKRIIVIKCWQWHRMTLEGQMADLREYLQGRFLCGFVYDQAARIVNPTGESVITRLFKILQTERYHIRSLRGLMKGRSNYEDTVPIVRHYFESGNFAMNVSAGSGGQILRHQINSQRFKENAHDLKEDNINPGNDHCFIAGTMVMTPDGEVPIETLNPGDWILNSHGAFPVLQTIATIRRPVMTLEIAGRKLTGTPNHPVHTTEGRKTIDCLHTSDMVYVCKSSSTTGEPIAAIPIQRTSPTSGTIAAWESDCQVDPQCCCIGPFGKTHTGPFPMDITSITKTAIQEIMNSRISSAYLDQRISQIICESATQTPHSGNALELILKPSTHLPKRGTPVQKDSSGTDRTESQGCSLENRCHTIAASAESATKPRPIAGDSAPTIVNQHGVGPVESITSGASASSAPPHSWSTDTARQNFVLERAQVAIAESEPQTVYTLTILGPPEYIANGVLVANCIDSLRYLLSLRPVYVAYQPNPKLWGPSTGGVDPHEGMSPIDHRVLSEEGLRHAELLAKGHNVARRHKLARIGRFRQRA